ncbi:MAG: cobalamin-dependent protein [Anaerolineae bacterium]|jgi:radical SAM superfamily enzyme YgiQ (UPF0313 family)
MRIALVNTNRIRPPIAPIGLDYLAEALHTAGHGVELLDLCWANDYGTAIADFFAGANFDLVGVTLRNTDDCAFTSRHSFLGLFADTVDSIRRYTDGLLVVGGVGFSVMPEEVLELSQADAGVWGDGESALVTLANRMEQKEAWQDVASLIWRRDGKWHRNPAANLPLTALPAMSRRWVDNRRYFDEGGQAGIETKRGCPFHCIYCADPVAKGRQTRTRPPEDVVDELESLLEQGVDHVHTCDSEFNIPAWHASAVCGEIVRRDLGDKLRWYAYCSPAPFSAQLARQMRRAGCVGINFGVDNGDEVMLRRLRREFGPLDIVNAARWCKEAGITVMLDLLLGAPGETQGSLRRTIELVRKAAPDRVGVALGVRVYPGTALAELVKQKKLRAGLEGGDDASEPLFFIEPDVAPFASQLLDELIGDDPRFFFFDPSRPEQNYNYNANQRLQDAIGEGYRGAYWDILRRYG